MSFIMVIFTARNQKLAQGLACIASIPNQIGAKAEKLIKQGLMGQPPASHSHGKSSLYGNAC